MIQEFCDRCMRRVGKMYDGGKDEPKFTVDHHYILPGMPRSETVVVCSKCNQLLQEAIYNWWKKR